MGKQLNFYRSDALMAELEAEALAQTRATKGHNKFTVQDLLRAAWEVRPEHLRLATRGKVRP